MKKILNLKSLEIIVNSFSNDKMPIFVTAKSNFSQELAIAGIKCITLDDSSAPNDC